MLGLAPVLLLMLLLVLVLLVMRVLVLVLALVLVLVLVTITTMGSRHLKKLVSPYHCRTQRSWKGFPAAT